MMLFDLLEARAAPLYHGCALGGAIKIITTDTVEDRTTHLSRAGSAHRDVITGVSMSRSLPAARQFGDIVFVFDQARLRQRHRIIPQDYWGQSGEPALAGSGRRQGKFAEAEEFVVGPIHHAARYVTAIFISPRQLAWTRKYGAEHAEPLLSHPLLQVAGRTV